MLVSQVLSTLKVVNTRGSNLPLIRLQKRCGNCNPTLLFAKSCYSLDGAQVPRLFRLLTPLLLVGDS